MRGSLLLFLTAFAGCYILLSAVFPGAAEGLANRSQLLRVELTHRGRRVSFLCLRDTGNSLTDPTSGQPVMVVWQQTLLPVAEYLDSEELYFLRYQSLGNPDGRLLCFRAEQVVIEGTVCRDLPVAIAGTPLSDGRSYTALWNGKESGNGLEQAERTSI